MVLLGVFMTMGALIMGTCCCIARSFACDSLFFSLTVVALAVLSACVQAICCKVLSLMRRRCWKTGSGFGTEPWKESCWTTRLALQLLPDAPSDQLRIWHGLQSNLHAVRDPWIATSSCFCTKPESTSVVSMHISRIADAPTL